MILITGANGLVGANLLYTSLKQGRKVKALIRTSASKESIFRVFSYFEKEPDTLFSQIDWAIGDITDRYSLLEAFEGITRVFHCAAIVSFDKSDRKLMMRVNQQGTANIVNQSLLSGIEKLVHVSSIAAIKTANTVNMACENDGWPMLKNHTYSLSKTLAEMEVWRGIAEGLNAVIVNPSVILGPGDWKRGSSEIISRIYKGMNYYTKGVTGFVDVDDVVKIMIQLMDSDLHSERYILNGANISFSELFEKAAHYLQVKPPGKFATPLMTEIAWRLEMIRSSLMFSKPLITKQMARSAHQKQYYSAEKIKATLSYEFTPIDTTLKKTSDIFLSCKDLEHRIEKQNFFR